MWAQYVPRQGSIVQYNSETYAKQSNTVLEHIERNHLLERSLKFNQRRLDHNELTMNHSNFLITNQEL